MFISESNNNNEKTTVNSECARVASVLHLNAKKKTLFSFWFIQASTTPPPLGGVYFYDFCFHSYSFCVLMELGSYGKGARGEEQGNTRTNYVITIGLPYDRQLLLFFRFFIASMR